MKRVFALVLAAALALALVACGGSGLNFTTGGAEGTYYGFGSVLATKVGSETDTKVTAITSGGSKANIETMEAGDAELGFVQSDVMAYAYEKANVSMAVASQMWSQFSGT